MGFRDLRHFNDALLGKQVWRLYHEKETSLYRVFRAKYFPSGDIFEAVQNPRCSYTWKSIMLARDVISNGALWRIGDGKDIQIWQHRWLPSPGSGKVLSPRLDQSLNVVQDLFIIGTKTWDFELIDRHFLPWEADGIKSIPLSEHHNIDLLIWPHTPDGSYSVRSAYRLLVAAQAQNQPSSSSTEASKRLWKGVWRMEVPNRVRQFVWRAVGESLPTKKNLKHPLRRPVPREVIKWSPPDESVYKINFDAAVFEEQGSAGLGVVVRDLAGLVISTLSQKIRFPGLAVMVEALVACRAVFFAKEISVFRVVVEGDSLQVIKAVNSLKRSKTPYGHIIDETRLLSSSLSCYNFVHVQREGNKLAHALARRAVVSIDTDVWMEDLSRDLDDVAVINFHTSIAAKKQCWWARTKRKVGSTE
ncbi:uncharacterized protein LOC126728906 [Quercus robur]|uniref:uncharacterized protein LOC126728906 n=1 Tax=Quercus robur TaxID=38942 RepID=UPI002161B002|nr:uncharacterized protein LOC126728906 [Quercus robur]